MADYVTIPDNEIAPESPVTSVLQHKLRDNPLAIAEGSPGAPRMQFPAVGVTAGNILTSYPEDQIPVTTGTLTKTGPGVVCGGVTGTIRIRFAMTLSAAGTITGQLWIGFNPISPLYTRTELGKEIFEFDYTLTQAGLLELRTMIVDGANSSAGELAIYTTGTIQFTPENLNSGI